MIYKGRGLPKDYKSEKEQERGGQKKSEIQWIRALAIHIVH